MTLPDPSDIRTQWFSLRESGEGLRALDIARRLGVAEAALVASACGGAAGPVRATRLEADVRALFGRLPSLGTVKAITRNAHAVIEVEGTYDNIEFFGTMGQSVSDIDLRVFSSRWKHLFAVEEETKRGVRKSLQFFDAHGLALHKLYALDATDAAAYGALVGEHAAADQSPGQALEPAPAPAPARPDAEVDVAGLRAAWLALKDTHEFHGLLRTFGVARTQALRLAGDDLAYRLAPGALEAALHEAVRAELPFMIFVGNPGVVQIFSGVVRRVVPTGGWSNVLDPAFNLHVWREGVAEAWLVRKPTDQGVITALEFYDAAGEQIALFVGKRKGVQPESPAWRALAEAIEPAARPSPPRPDPSVSLPCLADAPGRPTSSVAGARNLQVFASRSPSSRPARGFG
ncbi:MAG TPA: ChuX/HutX family heme-like substrate-binding protein [Polyangiaceae bacterium]|nr:ChuX/HutX family heme-like substrate-binding protein [Polyangiaceae bacterium]